MSGSLGYHGMLGIAFFAGAGGAKGPPSRDTRRAHWALHRLVRFDGRCCRTWGSLLVNVAAGYINDAERRERRPTRRDTPRCCGSSGCRAWRDFFRGIRVEALRRFRNEAGSCPALRLALALARVWYIGRAVRRRRPRRLHAQLLTRRQRCLRGFSPWPRAGAMPSSRPGGLERRLPPAASAHRLLPASGASASDASWPAHRIEARLRHPALARRRSCGHSTRCKPAQQHRAVHARPSSLIASPRRTGTRPHTADARGRARRAARAPDFYACGYRYTPGGQGRPENAPLAGLPSDYIVQQVMDFEERRDDALLPGVFPPADLMIHEAMQATPAEAEIAAQYFSREKLRPRVTSAGTPTCAAHPGRWARSTPRSPNGGEELSWHAV